MLASRKQGQMNACPQLEFSFYSVQDSAQGMVTLTDVSKGVSPG